MRKLVVKNTKGSNMKGGEYAVISRKDIKVQTKLPVVGYDDDDDWWLDDTVLGDQYGIMVVLNSTLVAQLMQLVNLALHCFTFL